MLEQEEKIEILDAIQHVVSTEVQKLSSRMDRFEMTQKEMQGSIRSLEVGQQELQGSVKSLEVGQQELHEVVQALAVHMDERFEQVDQRFGQIDQRFECIEGKVGQIGASMVTKDYLDDKLAEHGARYGEIDRKTNMKIGLLTNALVKEKSLSGSAAKEILSSEPFGRR